MFLILILHYAHSQVICVDQNNLTIQMEPSIEIPALNCSLNIDGKQLINMTSTQGNLQILGSTLLLDNSIQFIGFQMVEFMNLTLDCQIYTIISDSIMQFTNSIFQQNSNYIAQRIYLNNCVIQSIIFQNRMAFEATLNINGLTIRDSAFIHSTFCLSYFEMYDLIIQNVQFIDSSFGFVDKINKVTITQSHIHSSKLFQCQMVHQIKINTTNLILSTLFNTSGALSLIVNQMFIENSLLMVLQNENQVQLKSVIINNVSSDSSLIYMESPYSYVNDYIATNLSCLVNFHVKCKNALIYNSSFINLKGNVIISNTIPEIALLLNIFNIANSESSNMIDIFGKLSIKTGQFIANNCSLLALSINELIIDQFTFSNLHHISIINVSGVNVVQVQNVVISNSQEIIFASMNNVMSAQLQNISIYQCNECNFLTLNSTNAYMKDITVQNISNFVGSLIFASNSDIQQKRVNVTNIISITQVLIRYQDCQMINISIFNVNNVQQCKSVLQLKNIRQAYVSKSIFQDSRIKTGMITLESSNFTAFSNRFSQINSDYGSAFYISNSSIKIYNNSFQNLLAEYQGGAIYYNQFINNSYYIQENNVSDCLASFGNYIYLETNQISLKDSNYYIQGPVFLKVQNTTYSIDSIIRKTNQLTINNYKSGELIQFNLSILGSEEQSLCYFSEDLLIENQTFHFNQCNYKVEFRKYQDSPQNQSLDLQMQLNALTLGNQPLKFTLLLQIKECDIGEQWIQNICQVCEPGSYSLSSRETCLQCFPEALHCPGGAKIDLREGYWRPHNLTDLVEPCKLQKSACKGGPNNFTCGTGFIGALCEDCDYYGIVWEKGYARNYQNLCVECEVTLMSLLQAFTMLLWIVMVLYFSVSGALRMAKAQLIGHYLRIIGWHFGTRSTMVIDQTEVLFKMISTYFQLLSILIVVNVNFPQPFHNITKLIGNPLQIFGFQIECLLLHFPFEIIYLRQIGNLIISVVLVTIFIFGYFIHSLCCNQYYSMSAVFINTTIQVYFFFLQDLIEGLFEVLFCINASGQQYIQASTQYICHTPDHEIYIESFVIPALIIIGVVMPFYFVLKLYQNKDKLWSCSVRLPYGYLFMEYRIYYWEFLRFAIKFVFSLLSTLLIQEFKLLFLFAILILLLYQEMLYQIKPFIEFKYNSLDKIGTQLQILNLVLIYMQDDNSNEVTTYLITFIFSILNMAFILYFVYKISLELFRGYLKILQEKLVALLDNCPILQKCIKRPQPSSLPTKITYLWKKARQYVYALIEEQKKMQLMISQKQSQQYAEIPSNDISTVNESQFHSKLSESINSSLKLPKTVASIHQLVQSCETTPKQPTNTISIGRKLIRKQI